MGLKDIPPSDSNAILFRYKPYCATKSNIGYSGLSSEHESSNFCQSAAPRRSTIHKFSLPRFLAIHLARQSPFYGPPGHIGSRDGLQEDYRPATHGPQSPVSDWLGPIKARPHTFVKFTWHGNRHSTGLPVTLRFQVEPNWAHLDLFRELTI